MSVARRLVVGLWLVAWANAGAAANAATVLFEDRVVAVASVLADPNDLWVRPAELPRINDFELKPEGACFEDICVPVTQSEDSDIFVRRQGQAWFNVTELADRLQQPYVVDHASQTFSFGAIPVSRARFTEQGQAPDFTLKDRDGKSVSCLTSKARKSCYSPGQVGEDAVLTCQVGRQRLHSSSRKTS